MDIDEEWVKKIQMQKFQWHNSEWLNQTHSHEDTGSYEESAVIYANRKGIEAAAARTGMDDYYDESEDEDLGFRQTLMNTI